MPHPSPAIFLDRDGTLHRDAVAAGAHGVLIPPGGGSSVDNTGFLKEFKTLLEFAKNVVKSRKDGVRRAAVPTEGADASHV